LGSEPSEPQSVCDFKVWDFSVCDLRVWDLRVCDFSVCDLRVWDIGVSLRQGYGA
jgi:hypothetical protein